jgi:hypothetical protein
MGCGRSPPWGESCGGATLAAFFFMRAFRLVPALGATLLSCAGSKDVSAPSPSSIVGVAMAFSGTFSSSCDVISFQSCEPGPFGTGVAPGTPVTGTFTLDSTSEAQVILQTENYVAVRYTGVLVEVTLKGVTLTSNDPTSSYVEIYATPTYERYTITVPDGFRGGTVAGLSIDYAHLSFPIIPPVFPVTAPPREAAVFQPGLTQSPGAGIVLKHHRDKRYAMFGTVAPGPIVTGTITTLR